MNNDLTEIKEKIIENYVTYTVKNFSINKSDIDTFYFIGRKLHEYNITSNKSLEKIASNFTAELGIYVPKEVLKNSLKFYSYINNGMIINYNIKWADYLLLLNLNDIVEINKKIQELYF